MVDADGEPALWLEHARRFPPTAFGVVIDVHQGVACDYQIEGAVGEGQFLALASRGSPTGSSSRAAASSVADASIATTFDVMVKPCIVATGGYNCAINERDCRI